MTILVSAVSALRPGPGRAARAVLHSCGATVEDVAEEIARRAGPEAVLFGGLDRDALAAIGIDLDAVRARNAAEPGLQADRVRLTGQTSAIENRSVIFYLLLRTDWEMGSSEPVAVPGDEGFVHCCDERQIIDVRRRYFPADDEVVALAFDPTRLPVETRFEPGAGGEPERFPHVYGALGRELVSFVRASE